MKNKKIYKPKFLIDGSKIAKEGKFIAIPDKGFKDFKILVVFDKKQMAVDNWHKAETFRRFHDRFGGEDYTLGYFEWKPEEIQKVEYEYIGDLAVPKK
jgi:hypothetical protein